MSVSAFVYEPYRGNEIEESEISVRLANILRRAGFVWWTEIASKSVSQMLELDEFGTGCLAEVERELALRGLSFADTALSRPKDKTRIHATTKASRNAEICSARERGEPYTSIANRHGITAGRAAQIYRRAARRRDRMSDPHILRELRGEVSDAPAPLPAESPEWKSTRHARLLALSKAANPNFTFSPTHDQIDAQWKASR